MMTTDQLPRVRLTIGNWLAIAGLFVPVIGGLIDLKVSLATLQNDVAWLKARSVASAQRSHSEPLEWTTFATPSAGDRLVRFQPLLLNLTEESR